MKTMNKKKKEKKRQQKKSKKGPWEMLQKCLLICKKKMQVSRSRRLPVVPVVSHSEIGTFGFEDGIRMKKKNEKKKEWTMDTGE